MVELAKFQAYGNDFLVVPPGQVEPGRFAAFARTACDTHFGIGADGCIFLQEAGAGPFAIRLFNRDGSETGMSGNGTRCASAFIHREGLSREGELHLETPSGLKCYRLLASNHPVWTYRSSMGSPSFDPRHIPFEASIPLSRVDDWPIEVAGRTVKIAALSIGNPQCVIFGTELPGDAEFHLLGPALEKHAFFPERTNVSFARVSGPRSLEIRIWERGVGPTLSSGTGSCGAAVAAVASGRVGAPVEVRTASGTQFVEWQPGGEIYLTGSVEFVADIRFFWPLTAEQELRLA